MLNLPLCSFVSLPDRVQCFFQEDHVLSLSPPHNHHLRREFNCALNQKNRGHFIYNSKYILMMCQVSRLKTLTWASTLSPVLNPLLHLCVISQLWLNDLSDLLHFFYITQHWILYIFVFMQVCAETFTYSWSKHSMTGTHLNQHTHRDKHHKLWKKQSKM